MTKELREKLTDFAALLTAVVALGTTIKELREALQGAGTEVWKNWPWYVVPAVIFLAILLWRRDRLVQWLNPRSTVSRRDAFHIGRKYLLGREADIERLLRTLAEWPLVFLVGESGAGKSSLLERGILPRLKESSGQLPLLINSWGPDWIEGPREALAQALEAAIDEPLRKLLGVEGPVSPGDALAVVGRLRSKATRTPTLLFDQVDDYQTRHRDKFLSGSERTLLSAEALATANPFWREVADLLKSGVVRCLFTTRSDAKIGLESVRFQEPKAYLLDPLEKSAAADLLAEISRDAINHPERSFDRLKERLLNDLAADGWVLPIQMQVAFSGLAEMRFLSVGEYERQGGLPGLEALHLESRISAAARAVSVSVTEVRAVLLSLVDRVTRKTVAQPTEKLQQASSGGNKLMDLLEKLESDEVVRRRLDPGGEGSVWLLDHDYLSRGVLELDRRAQRWALLLEESARSYEGARGVFEHWKKLLPPFLQVRLLYERLRRRLGYGNAAAYARVSTIKILVWLLIPLLAWFGWHSFSVWREAERLFAEFSEGQMATGELRALWSLTGKDRRLRRLFLDTALAHGPNARRFIGRGERTLHAAIGLREEDRQYVLEKIVPNRCMLENSEQSVADPVVINTCALLIQQTSVPADDVRKIIRSWLPLVKDLQTLSAIKEFMISSLSFSDPELVQSLSRKAFDIYIGSEGPARYVVGPLLVREDRRRLADLFLQSLRTSGARGGVIEHGLYPLGDVMTIDERREVLDWAVRSLANHGDAQSILGVYRVVEADLPRGDKERVLNLVLSRPRSSEETLRLALSSSGFREVLSSARARELLESWFSNDKVSLRQSQPFDYFSVHSLVERLSPSDAAIIWRLCQEALVSPSSIEQRFGCLTMISPIAARLSFVDAENASKSILAAMEVESKAVLYNLGGILEGLAEKLPPSVAQDMYELILKKLNQVQGEERSHWMSGLIVLGPLLGSPMIAITFQYVVEEMRRGSYSWNVDLSKFVTTLPDNRVREVVALVTPQLEHSDSPFEVVRLIELLEPRLEPKERQQVLKALFRRLENDSAQLNNISRALILLGKEASPELVLPALQKWIDKNRLSAVPNCAEVVPLVLDPREPRVIDLLKWPTCSSASRNILVSRLDHLVSDATFGTKGPMDEYHADIWGKFLPWARKQGLDVDSPPILPDLDRLNAERFPISR